MSFIARDTGGDGNFKTVPAGAFIGRCYELIDMGTQTNETGQYAGKSDHKIKIGFELFGDDEDGNPLTTEVDGKEMPLTITKDYTVSLHEKANLRKELTAWRGKAFTPEESEAFDVSKLIGAYAMVNVTHKTNDKGKTRANISGLSPLPSALKNAKPSPVHANRIFDLDNPDMKMFDTFYEYLQEQIKKSPEWKAFRTATVGNSSAGELQNSSLDDIDSIPF
jgi:hypothetical protein